LLRLLLIARSSREWRQRLLAATSGVCLVLACAAPGSTPRAETLQGALAKAYGFSPDLGQQRAATRAADEGVPRATAGYRPTVTASGTTGAAWSYNINNLSKTAPMTENTVFPRSAQVSVTQTLYNGNRNFNGVRQAESTVLQSRETLRQSEQTILNAAAVAYMNVLRDTALLRLQENNTEVVAQQLKQTKDRFQVGEVTRTDVAQSEAAVALSNANAFTARSNLQNSLAVYRQLIGEQPKNLSPGRPVDNLIPKRIDEAITFALSEHPTIQAALHAVDVAALNVKVQEGTLYPTVSVTGSYGQTWDTNNAPHSKTTTASAIGTLSIPIYDGGLNYSNIRQAKEQLGQARLNVDVQRETIRAQVVSAFNAYQNSKLIIQSFQAQVRASEIALNGVREEARVGQRTTLDVLNSQQTLLTARSNLITAQRDQVVNSYAMVLAMGRMSAANLGLAVNSYDPSVHFDQVKGKMWGLRTPDGR
jgi:outer membrane protein